MVALPETPSSATSATPLAHPPVASESASSGWKTIVVQLDDEPSCDERVRVAARLAATHGAHLIGVAAIGRADVRLAGTSVGPEVITVVRLSAGDLREAATRRAARFERVALAAGAPTTQARIVAGTALDATVRVGRWSDLTIAGPTSRERELQGVPRDLARQVALQTGGPVLVVPTDGPVPSLGRDILVAWNDSRGAARALGHALPLLRRARSIVLLELDDVARSARSTVLGAQARLGRLGVRAGIRRVAFEGEAGAVILAMAAEMAVDVLVMGAFDRSLAHEWVFGGASRHVLGHAALPTLMAH